MTIPLLSGVREWYCPQCGKTAQTKGPVRNRFHTCPKLRGLAAPMLPKGVKAKVEVREREDYVNGETVQLDPEQKRPVMSVVTTRDDGQDVAVFAPTATGRSD
jgi:hypothetical protein